MMAAMDVPYKNRNGDGEYIKVVSCGENGWRVENRMGAADGDVLMYDDTHKELGVAVALVYYQNLYSGQIFCYESRTYTPDQGDSPNS